jgi:predicted DNA-binding protein
MPRKKRFTKRITIRMSVETHRKIKLIASIRGVSMAQIVRELLELAIANLEKGGEKAMEALRRDLLKSKEF